MTKWVQDILMATPNAFSFDASVKPCVDFTEYLAGYGYRRLKVQRFGEYDPYMIQEAEQQIQEGDIVAVISPSYCGPDHEQQFINMVHSKGGKIICHVHDIDDIRWSDHFTQSYIDMMNTYDVIIVQSIKQLQWLRKCGLDVNSKFVVQDGPFGYINPMPYEVPKNTKGIIYTGNMNKVNCGYLEDLAKLNRIPSYQLPLHITKSILPEQVHFEPEDNVHRLDLTVPDMLPTYVNRLGGWGLNYNDDDSVQGKRFLNYNSYNWSHKLSAYLVAGLPVLVHKDTLAASYVDKHRLGIVFDSYQSIPHLVNNVNDIEYAMYTSNVRKILHLIKTGYYVCDAFMEAELLLNK